MDSKGFCPRVNNSSVDITQSVEDDPLIDGPLISQDALNSAIKREFQKLPTTWTAVLLVFLHVVYVVLCVVLMVQCWLLEAGRAECSVFLSGVDPQGLLVLGKVGIWLLVLLFERWVLHHHGTARSRGYLHFYRSTRSLKRLPLLIHSTGNAAVLIILSPAATLDVVKNLSVYLLLGVLGLELLLSVTCLVIYTVHVVKFNTERPSPDINQEERSHAYSSNTNLTHTETGFRDGSSLEEVVEKQADLIEYLKQHNTLLSKRILTLTSQQARD